MNEQNERMIDAIGKIDEKYIKESEERVSTGRIIKIAASFAIVIALALYLFLPFAPVKSNVKAYSGSEYFPLIQGIDQYRVSLMQPRYKNNFESIVSNLDGLFAPKFDASGGNNLAAAPEDNMDMSNGSYVEATDNQVSGVIESDIFKMTDKYIFRIGYKNEEDKRNYVTVLRVYSIAGENSAIVAEFDVPTFADERYNGFDYQRLEMYLSNDCNRVTLIKTFNDSSGNQNVGLISLDVSDVKNISVNGMVCVDGELNTSRMVDGKLLLVTEFGFRSRDVDYNDPATFVPTVDSGKGPEAIKFDDIIYPDKVTNTNYSVVALIDTENLSLLGANALLNFTGEVYVSAENVYISREYTKKTEEGNGIFRSNMSDIAVFGYSGEALEEKGIITAKGFIEDQYSFDEKDGYLRVVTSTRESRETMNGSIVSMTPGSINASLYVFDLSNNSLAYSYESFAIEGEQVTAVRFDGDKVYVCTAVVVSFTDPVYFIDLSDYENITSTDTGIIDGFSDHLINFGEGLALGIGREGWDRGKVEIYAENGDAVVSVHEYKFSGEYSTNYKSYLVNREENIFGFGVDYFYEYDSQTGKGRTYQRYVVIKFDEEVMTVFTYDIDSLRASAVRAAYIDGYLYITTNTALVVEKI